MNIKGIDEAQLRQAYTAMQGIKIPSIPQTLLALKDELNEDEPDQQKITRLISEDISLSGKVIQSINSAAFGLKVKVTSIEHATIILGVRNLKDTIISSALRKALEDALPGYLKITEYSSQVGTGARLAAERSGLTDPEEAFMVGLFHEAGSLLLMQRFDNYAELYDQYRNNPTILIDEERALFGSTHALISFLLAYHWKLPTTVCAAIAHHHTQDISAIGDDETRLLLSAIQIGLFLTYSSDPTYELTIDTEEFSALRKAAMVELGLDDDSLLEIETEFQQIVTEK